MIDPKKIEAWKREFPEETGKVVDGHVHSRYRADDSKRKYGPRRRAACGNMASGPNQKDVIARLEEDERSQPKGKQRAGMVGLIALGVQISELQ